VHALEGDAKKAALAEGDPLESFPGGHTASIMAITASTATIATLRGYRLAPLVWIIGSTLAVTSTYLRIAADQHYFTDNVAGAVIGGVVGAGVPLLFHRRVDERPSAATRWLRGATLTSSAVPGGRVVGLGWAF
jgi:membrane-associated phospholipid phosphatase